MWTSPSRPSVPPQRLQGTGVGAEAAGIHVGLAGQHALAAGLLRAERADPLQVTANTRAGQDGVCLLYTSDAADE